MHTLVSDRIEENQALLAQLITDIHFNANPQLEIVYGKAGRVKCLQDAKYHLRYLAEAIRYEAPELFTHYIDWAASMLEARKIPSEDLKNNVAIMGMACQKILQLEEFEIINEYLTIGKSSIQKRRSVPDSFIKEAKPFYTFSRQYLDLLLVGDRRSAQALIMGLVKDGYPISDIYEHIFQDTQHEIGLLWQTNKISVAHEHFCTAATQQIIAGLYPYIFSSDKKKNKLIACAVTEEQHELGIRMVTDIFEMNGWDTYYMGANMPAANIISAIKEQNSDLLAISVTMTFHLRTVETLIKKIKSDAELSNFKIIVGGLPFTICPALWKKLGADGVASSAKEALAIAHQLIIKS